MADTFTTYYNLTKPQVGGDPDTWGGLLNTNFDTIDTQLHTASTYALPLTGGTLTGTLAGTSASFSGNLTTSGVMTAATNFNSSTTTAALSASAAGGQVLLRPNGSGSSTGQLVLDASGNGSIPGTFTAGTNVAASTNFLSTTANVLLAPNGAGIVYLRPNGVGSTTGQVTVNSAGVLEATNLLSDNNVTANTNFLSSNTFWLAAPNGAGTFFFRPNGSASTTNQTTMGSNGIWQGVDFQATSDERLKEFLGPLKAGYAELKRMAPEHFIKYSDAKHSGEGHEEVGFRAQKVQKVLPTAVTANADGILTVSPIQLIALVANAVLQLGRALELEGIL